jgi:shikimate dehydrogenase
MTTNGAIKAGVMGWPISHSLSPRLHGFWLKQYGINGTYELIAVEPKNFDQKLRTLLEVGFAGVNVTVPHKEAAVRAVDEVDDHASRIGAINTIVFDKKGRMLGRNTDGFGFIENLKARSPDWNPQTGPVVVLGAGGACRAIVAALVDAGVPEIRLVNRTKSRTLEVARDIGGNISAILWEQREAALENSALLVNTTVLGMVGKPSLKLSLEKLPSNALVTDIVYAPMETILLKNAKARGNPVVDGLGMLLHQGRPGFEAWFGHKPEVTIDLRAHVLAGMMG